MLLTTEEVTTEIEARTILRWYTYRWRIEEYHQILKSGCNAESYRLGGGSMAVWLGFLTSIAAKLLKMTYLNRTEPETSAEQVLNPLRILDLNQKLASVVQELEEIKEEGEVAPPSCWIVKYQAKGRGGRYWYYKWMAREAIFINQKQQSSKSKYIGKAERKM